MTDSVPASMQAVVLHGPKRVEIEQRPVPELGPHDVLLEISHCGVCGSDLHFVLDGWGRAGLDRRARVQRSSRRRRRGRHRWTPGDLVVGGPSTTLWCVRVLPCRSSVVV